MKNLHLLCLSIAYVLMMGCNPQGQHIPEPAYNPWILKPETYVPSTGKVVNMDSDSIAEPITLPVRTEYLNVENSNLNSNHNRKPRQANPTFVSAKPKVIHLDSMPEPKYYVDKGTRVEAAWPKWKATQPAYPSDSHYPYFYLDQDQGLSSSSVQDILEDKFGRLWIATISGLNVWDGNGLVTFTKNEGLNGYDVNCLMKDSKGNIWIGTRGDGISVWDGNGFVHFSANEEMRDLSIWAFMEDRHGNIWIASSYNGIFIWDGEGFTNYTTEQGLGGNFIWDIIEDRHGNIWIASKSEGGGLHKWEENKILHYTSENGLSGDRLNKLWEDKYGNIWIALTGGGGLNVYHPSEKGKIEGFWHYSRKDGLVGSARKFADDKKGRIWMSDGNGISIWTPNENGIEGYITHYSNTSGLRFDRVWVLFCDSRGNMWIGSRAEGLIAWNMQGTLQYTPSEGLKRRVYSQLMEDKQGNIWIGRSGWDGVPVWNGSIFKYFKTSEGPGAYTGTSLLEDSVGNIWIGASDLLDVWDESRLIRYHLPGFQYINSLLEDQEGNIWFSSNTVGGLGVFDREEYIRYTTEEGLINNKVNCLLKDGKDNIWVGTEGGISVLSPVKENGKREMIQYTTENGLRNENVLSLLEDRQGNIWIGTDEGISIWDQTGFFHYPNDENLMGRRILSFFEDEEGVVWVGTSQGLVKVTPTEGNRELSVKTFRKTEGIRGVAIQKILIDRKKTMWIAFNKGIESLDLTQLQADTTAPKLFIRELQPFFKPVDWRQIQRSDKKVKVEGEKNEENSFSEIYFDSVLIHTNLPDNPSFPHDFNHLTLSWTGTYGIASSKLQYTYFLQGRDKAWSPLSKDYNVSFQDLRPGDYTFKVRAVGDNGRWSETAAYSFTIRPPWWQTIWAYMLYVGALLLAVYRLIQWRTVILRRQRQLLRTRVTEQTEELRIAKNAAEAANEAKSTFLSTVSHELRTPLTSIVGFTEIVKERLEERVFPFTQSEEKKTQRAMKQASKNLGIIKQEGERLTNLINGLLDLAKIEARKIEWNMKEVNPVELVERATAATAALFEQKPELQLITDIPDNLPTITADRDRIIQVLINLISNAVKFTDKGHVKIRCEKRESGSESPKLNEETQKRPYNPQLETRNPKPQSVNSPSEGSQGNEKNLEIIPLDPPSPTQLASAQGGSGALIVFMVEDTGTGIPVSYLDKVFEKFQQVEDQQTGKPKGTGLGLPICKEIVEHHDGTIWVESEEGRGSIFSFTLPILT